MLRWLDSYLSSRSQRVIVGNCTSSSTQVLSGVPQGSILGPTLFTAFIDPLLRQFRLKFSSQHLQAYADDTLLLAPITKWNELADLVQPAINFVSTWVRDNGLEFNDDKTDYIIFRYGHGRLPDLPQLHLSGHVLAPSNEVKYLGIIFSSDMKFSEHISDVVRRSNCMLGALRRRIGKRVPSSVFGTIYRVCIRSVIEYGCPVWDPILAKDVSELERSQFNALRLFFNDWTVSYDDALGRAGWSTLFARRQRLILSQFYKYYHRFHDFDNSRFVHKHESEARISARLNHPCQLVLPRHFYDGYKQSFMYSGIVLWNAFTEDNVLSSFPAFKTAIGDFRFSQSSL